MLDDRERVIARIAGDPVSYGGMDNLGWSFMEKMIHLPVRIPELSQRAVSDYADSPCYAFVKGDVSSDVDMRGSYPAGRLAPAPRRR